MNYLYLMIQICTLILLTLLSTQVTSAETGDAETIPLYDDLGHYHYSISAEVPLVQEYFNQGLRLYYAFNHAEAIRAFRMAQRLDPSCAMCWWAEALSWGPNINMPMDATASSAAFTAINEALKRRAAVSVREQDMIDALAVRYGELPLGDRSELDARYANAMSELAGRYPADKDIAVLYAEALMDLRPWDYWKQDGTAQEGIDIALAQLGKVMRRDEKHPGACHFYIHAVEAIYPERAVECAERLANLMPGAGHLVHMPGHIYIRVGRYLDAVAANEHAVHADETYIRDQQPGMGMYTAGYYPHNYDFMAFAAMMIGQSETSISSAKKVTSLLPPELFGSPGMDFLQHMSVRPMLMQVRFARWNEILEVPEPPADRLHARGLWHYARGRAFAARNDDRAMVELVQLRELAVNPELGKIKLEFNQSSDLIAIAERVLTSWQASAVGEFETAIAAMNKAVSMESELFYGEPPEWSVPIKQELGALLLLADKPEQAEKVFRSDLDKFPENGWSLYGLIQALEELGRDKEAAEYSTILNRIWSTADVELEEIF